MCAKKENGISWLKRLFELWQSSNKRLNHGTCIKLQILAFQKSRIFHNNNYGMKYFSLTIAVRTRIVKLNYIWKRLTNSENKLRRRTYAKKQKHI